MSSQHMTISAASCDLTLAEAMGLKRVTTYTVSQVTDLADVQRVQAFADAQNRDIRWRMNRNGTMATIEVVSSRIDPQPHPAVEDQVGE